MAIMQLWICLLSLTSACLIGLFESDETPPEISLSLHSLLMSPPSNPTLVLYYLEKSAGVEGFLLDIAVDLLYREDLSFVLRETVGESGYVRLWTRKGPIAGEDFEQAYLSAFSAYISLLTLENTHIIATTDYISHAQALQSQWPHLYPSSFSLPTAISLDFALNFIGKTIKPAAINHLALFTDPKSTDNLLTALDLKGLNKLGYVYILSQTASLYRFNCEMKGLRGNGVLFVGEIALVEELGSGFWTEMVRNQINRIFQAYENGNFHSKITLPPPQFHLFSLQNSHPQLSNTLSPLNFPTKYRAQIAISANYDLFDAYSPHFNIGNLLFRGLKIAFDEVNSRHDLLPNYYMVNNTVNCL